MAQLGIILGILAIFGGAVWGSYEKGFNSGFATNKSEVLKVKNTELALLNTENLAMQETIDEERRENIDWNMTLEDKHRRQLKNVERENEIAMDDLSTTLRMQLDAAKNAGKDKDHTQDSGPRTFISGLAGTEGSKLTPETRYTLEQLSFYGDTSAVLFGLCTATAKRDRGIE